MDTTSQSTPASNPLPPTQGEWSPLSGNPKTRDYTSANVPENEIVDRLPTPEFKAPSSAIEGDEENDLNQQDPARPFNPRYEELPNKDKMAAAGKMAETILDAYGLLVSKAGGLAKISEKKLDREIIEGTINGSLHIPVDANGTTVGVKGFTAEYNSTVDQAFFVDEEFKQTVKPPLERVLAKRGIGMTDENQLMYYFGKDLVLKGTMFFSLKSNSKEIMNMLREQTLAINAAQAPMQVIYPDSPPSPAPAPAAVEVVRVEESAPIAPVVQNKETGFNKEYVSPAGVKEFGDPETLKHMNKTFPDDNAGTKQTASQRGSKPNPFNKKSK